MVAKLHKIIEAMTKEVDARAQVHGQLDAFRSVEKKGKDKKRKNEDTEVLATEKGKALPRH